jgi:hypothetical protein
VGTTGEVKERERKKKRAICRLYAAIRVCNNKMLKREIHPPGEH